jgi:hypothetical protein
LVFLCNVKQNSVATCSRAIILIILFDGRGADLPVDRQTTRWRPEKGLAVANKPKNATQTPPKGVPSIADRSLCRKLHHRPHRWLPTSHASSPRPLSPPAPAARLSLVMRYVRFYFRRKRSRIMVMVVGLTSDVYVFRSVLSTPPLAFVFGH